MNASTWIELAGLVLGGGGGATGVAKLTRLVVAVEHLAEEIKQDRDKSAKTAEKVQEHEVRLVKGGLLQPLHAACRRRVTVRGQPARTRQAEHRERGQRGSRDRGSREHREGLHD